MGLASKYLIEQGKKVGLNLEGVDSKMATRMYEKCDFRKKVKERGLAPGKKVQYDSGLRLGTIQTISEQCLAVCVIWDQPLQGSTRKHSLVSPQMLTVVEK